MLRKCLGSVSELSRLVEVEQEGGLGGEEDVAAAAGKRYLPWRWRSILRRVVAVAVAAAAAAAAAATSTRGVGRPARLAGHSGNELGGQVVERVDHAEQHCLQARAGARRGAGVGVVGVRLPVGLFWVRLLCLRGRTAREGAGRRRRDAGQAAAVAPG